MIREDEIRDAEYRIEIAPDRMAATLTVIPENGGVPADAEGIDAALARAGVVFGIDPGGLAKALAGPNHPVVVAHGTAPQPCVDGRLELLIDVTQVRHPKEDDRGRADFRELGILRSVEQGTALMRRHPPLPGVPGQTVLGAEVPTPKPKDAKFPVRLQGVEISPNDADLLIAAIAG